MFHPGERIGFFSAPDFKEQPYCPCKPVEQEENHEKAHAGRGLETIWERGIAKR
jgi:hypothetical protein